MLLFSGVYVLVNLLVDLSYTVARPADPLLMAIAVTGQRLAGRAGARGALVAPLRAPQPDPGCRRRRSSALIALLALARAAGSPAMPLTDAAGAAAAPALGGALARHRRSRPRRLSRAPSMARASRSFVGLSVAASRSSLGLADRAAGRLFPPRRAVVMRLMDGLMAIPAILLAIALVALTRASVSTVIVAITIPEVPRVVRLVRSVVLDGARAALCRGGDRRRHADVEDPRAPHPAERRSPPLIVQATYICASAILIEAGAVLPRRRHAAGDSDLGQHDRLEPRCSSRGRRGPSSCPASRWRSSCSAVNLLGDGLRDRLDPRLARRM